MKMKEFGPLGGTRPWRPPLDPPMVYGKKFAKKENTKYGVSAPTSEKSWIRHRI